MTKSIEVTGKTESIAIENALKQLGLERDEVSVEVIARAKSGFLGIGSQPARVRVSYEAPDEAPAAPAAPAAETPAPVEKPAPKAEQKKKPQPKAAPAEKPAPKAEHTAPAAEATDPAALEAGSVEERIYTFLSGLLSHMGNEGVQISITLEEGGAYQVTLLGQGLGSLIGRRGETLDAIQQLTNYSVNRGSSHRARIHLDAENYRAKREESLQRLARKTAAKVVKNRRNVTLEPMNAYERHVIHTALQDYRNVTTYSVGTEPNRRLVIAYSRGERYNNFAE